MHTNFKPILRVAVLAVFAGVVTNYAYGEDAQNSSSEKEQQLLAILRSDAKAADKAIACKNLAIDGSTAAVPDLAKLLPDPQLSSWARIALEAIPGPASGEALLNATQAVEGPQLVGIINSIGVRRDAQTVDILASRLQDENAQVAAAAAVALGRIGNPSATKSLREALITAPTGIVRYAVAEGCVLCAEQLLANGKTSEAAEVYDQVRSADVPLQRVIEATRGAILARKDDGIPLLLEQFRSSDKKFFQLALGTAREFPGDKVDGALAKELANATPGRAALIVQVMADRPDTVDLADVLKASEQGDKMVRLSAINALQRVGDDSCLSLLLQVAIDSDKDLAEAARQTLAVLPGQHVDGEIGTMLPTASGERYRVLLQLVGQRRISVVEEVEKALVHRDESVRHAALIALGETVPLNKLSVLISQVSAPVRKADLTMARKALKTASVRMPDREACATQLTVALKRSPRTEKDTFLEILSDVGGTKALQTLGDAAMSSNAQLQDTSSRLLGKWNGVDAAPVLLKLAKSGKSAKYRIRGLRGYIGLARKFTMPDAQRAQMCQNAFELASRSAEKALVLDVLKLRPSAEGFQLAVKALQDSDLKEKAMQSTLVIAQKIGSKGGDVKQLLADAGLPPVKLEIIKAEYGAGASQKNVTAMLQKQAGDQPLITLAAASYNANFGGDPAPGTQKKLSIEYRINGKAGEASFVENALIILPMPN